MTEPGPQLAEGRGETRPGAGELAQSAAAPAPQELGARLRRTLDLMARAAATVRADRVQVRAMALTYISVFALVPALVVAFSVVQAFTGMDRIAKEVHEFLLDNLAVGARTSIQPYLDRFVLNTHAARAGIIGGAILLASAYSLLSNVERAVNDLWEVQRRRSFRMQALVYWMGITLGPLVLALSATASQVAQAYLASMGAKTIALLASALLSSSFLTVLYLVVPTCRVRLRCAMAGGVAAGIAWEVAKWIFALFVAKFVRYSAIYGSVASIPIFLTWMYLSWTIVLYGARLAFIMQNASSVMAPDAAVASSAGRELLAGQAMVAVARAFQEGRAAPTPEQVARSLRAGMGALEVIEALRKARLLEVLTGGGLVPARAPEALTLLDVRHALRGADPLLGRKLDPISAALRQADDRSDDRLRLTTIRDLCAEPASAATEGQARVSPPSGLETGLSRPSVS